MQKWFAMRLWSAAVAVALALAFGVAPAQSAPFVYVTNARGGDVSQFDIGAGGLLTPLIPAAVPAGIVPGGVAVSPDGRSVYVANYDGESVSQYDVGADGTLSPKNPATVATDISLRVGDVAVNTDGKSVYVTATLPEGREWPGYVLQFDVGAGGTLSPKSPPTVPADFFASGVAVSPDGKSVYVTANSGPLGYLGYVLQYDVGAGGALSPKTPALVLADACPSGIAVSPDGQNVYVANACTGPEGVVSQYDVGAGGVLFPKDPPAVVAGIGPSALAVSPNGQNVYVANTSSPFSSASVSQYDVGAGGLLSPKSPASVLTGGIHTGGVAVSPDSQNFYVTSGEAVSQYDVAADGSLSPKNPARVAAGIGPSGIAITPLARVPTGKEQCKEGGWRDFPRFRNEGKCVSFVQTHR
jgi:DNA-binding beta-propeller fold protein YncE